MTKRPRAHHAHYDADVILPATVTPCPSCRRTDGHSYQCDRLIAEVGAIVRRRKLERARPSTGGG